MSWYILSNPRIHCSGLRTFVSIYQDPVFPFPGRAYVSSDYRALANLMTHVTDIDPDVAVKNAVLSVFFLRFLKKAGYFRSGEKQFFFDQKNKNTIL